MPGRTRLAGTAGAWSARARPASVAVADADRPRPSRPTQLSCGHRQLGGAGCGWDDRLGCSGRGGAGLVEAGVPSYAGFRFPAEIISHGVWLYHRFPLSLREVEELMLQRGIVVSHETVRQWCAKFGQTYANGLRRRRPRPGDRAARGPGFPRGYREDHLDRDHHCGRHWRVDRILAGPTQVDPRGRSHDQWSLGDLGATIEVPTQPERLPQPLEAGDRDQLLEVRSPTTPWRRNATGH
jgi:hypothetical protein